MRKRRQTSNAEVLTNCQRTLNAEWRSVEPAAQSERGCVADQPQKHQNVSCFRKIRTRVGPNTLLRLVFDTAALRYTSQPRVPHLLVSTSINTPMGTKIFLSASGLRLGIWSFLAYLGTWVLGYLPR